MTALLTDETPNSAIPFVAKLVVTWACSLLWGLGVFLAFWAFIIAAVAGLINFFSPPAWDSKTMVMLAIGFTAIFSSPFFLGTFFARNWRKGLASGLFALFAGAVGNILFDPFAGFLYNTVSSSHVDVYYYSFLSAFPAALTIVTVLLWTQFPRFQLGMALGLMIGLAITLADGIILGRYLLVSNNIFHLLWQVPPLTWVSIVFYSESTAKRGGWVGFVIWSLLILITFSLPFLVVHLFPLQ